MEGTFFQALVIPGHSPDADSLAHYCSSTGVIYCTDRAADMGNGSLLDKVSYRQDFTMKTLNGQISARWTCHGYDCLTLQGAPETGDIPGAMHKPSTIEVKPESLEETKDYLSRKLEGRALVFLTSEMVDSGLFGTGAEAPRFRERIGRLQRPLRYQ